MLRRLRKFLFESRKFDQNAVSSNHLIEPVWWEQPSRFSTKNETIYAVSTEQIVDVIRPAKEPHSAVNESSNSRDLTGALIDESSPKEGIPEDSREPIPAKTERPEVSAKIAPSSSKPFVLVSELTPHERATLISLSGSRELTEADRLSVPQVEVIRKIASLRLPPKPHTETHSTTFQNLEQATTSTQKVRINQGAAINQHVDNLIHPGANKRLNHIEHTRVPSKLPEATRLNDEQSQLFNYIESTSENIFVTGRAGSGKSFLLRHLLSNTHKVVLPVAYTGVAALNIEGVTIHSAFGLPTRFIHPNEAALLGRELYYSQSHLLRSIDMLVVDEVSMVSADIFEAIDTILRTVRETERPFGGVQVVLFGDPYQLPPIVSESDIHEFYADNWGSEFFFSSPAWHQGLFKKVDMISSVRQTDKGFLEILDNMRTGNITFAQQEMLNSRVVDERHITANGSVRIAGTGIQADNYNNYRLSQLPGKEIVFTGEFAGNYPKKTERLPAPLHLRLKPNSQVIMVKNHPARIWVNGTLATVPEVMSEAISVEIDNICHEVDRVSWEKFRHTYNRSDTSMKYEVVASYKQYPIDLGWARTIHKAQGQTFDVCVIDLNRKLFEKGQAYVACSRCRSLEGLYLTAPLEMGSILTSDLVHEFMSDLTPALSLSFS